MNSNAFNWVHHLTAWAGEIPPIQSCEIDRQGQWGLVQLKKSVCTAPVTTHTHTRVMWLFDHDNFIDLTLFWGSWLQTEVRGNGKKVVARVYTPTCIYTHHLWPPGSYHVYKNVTAERTTMELLHHYVYYHSVTPNWNVTEWCEWQRCLSETLKSSLNLTSLETIAPFMSKAVSSGTQWNAF